MNTPLLDRNFKPYLTIFAKRFFPEIVLVLFFILTSIGIARHDMWGDEMQAWLIAKASHSIQDIFIHLRYEGHPFLWYFLLFIVQKFSSNPVSMQVLHLFLANITVYLILKYSPFSRIHQFLLVFGYFFLYEYTMISRNYILGILFIVIFCILAAQPQKKYLHIAITLILLSFTHILGVILAVSFGVYLAVEYLTEGQHDRETASKAIIAAVLLIAAIIISVYLCSVPEDAGYVRDQIRMRGPGFVLWRFNRVFVPDKFLTIYPYKWLRIMRVMVIGIFCTTFFFFGKKRSVFILYLTGTFLLLIFFSFAFFVAERHLGYFYILLISCWWLYPKLPRLAIRLMTVILLFQFYSGILTYIKALHEPFTGGKRIAEYIMSNGMASYPIILDSSWANIVGYLDKPVFYSRGMRRGTYTIYDNAQSIPENHIVAYAGRLSKLYRSDVLIVQNKKISRKIMHRQKKLTMLYSAKGRMDSFYLYLFNQDPPPRLP